MSPARPSTSRRSSSGGFKPYTRGVNPHAMTPPHAPAPSGASPAARPGSGTGSGSISPHGRAAPRSHSGSPTSPNPNPNSPPHTPHLHSNNLHSPSHQHQPQHQHQHHHLTSSPPTPSAPPPPPPPPPPSHIAERPGFPTYAQYKQVESAYLRSLTPRRQGKALISQRMFDRIWDVLHQPDAPGETAQFRFWARKMFTVRAVGAGAGGGGTAMGMRQGGVNGGLNGGGSMNGWSTGPPTAADFAPAAEQPQEVLLHDGLLVAIQEQLYDLLCYCHGSTGHGGRDKTCALIRKHYTWVPKDLVSSFIKTCPTCIMKKCGGGAGVGVGVSLAAGVNAAQQQIQMQEQQREMEQQMQMQQIQQRQDEQHHRLQMHHQHQQEATGLPLPGMRDFFQNMYGMDLGAPSPSALAQGVPWPTMGDAHASEHPAAMGMGMSLSMSGSGSRSGSAGVSRSGSGNDSGHSGSTPGLGSSSGSGSSGSMHRDDEDPQAPAADRDDATARAHHHQGHGKPRLHGGYPVHPMVREVALYKGLPNGWQYRHADYASAHAEFVAAKAAGADGMHMHMNMSMNMDVDADASDAVMQRPRVPSILPLWGPDKFTQPEYEAVAAGNAEQLRGLSPVLPCTLDGNGNGNSAAAVDDSGVDAQTHFARGTQQMSLQYLLMNAPRDAAGPQARPYTPQIDPVLLGYPAGATTDSGSSPALGAASSSASAPGTGTSSDSGPSLSTFNDATSAPLGSSARFPSSPSLKRAAAAPLRIHLEFPPPETSFQALLAYRDSLGDGNLTPDSPHANVGGMYVPPSSGPPSLVYPESPSPSLRSDGSGGSAGSQLSQLSAFRVSITDDAGVGAQDGSDGGTEASGGFSHSNDSTPASSALPTPVDEYGSSAANAGVAVVDIKGKKRMDFDVAETQTRLEKELSEGIQIVLGLQNSAA